jgi:hypothetical protein
MQSITDSGVNQPGLELRPSNRVLLLPGLMLVPAGLYFVFSVVWPHDRPEFLVGAVGCLFVVVAAVFLAVVAARTNADEWRVRLQVTGVTVRGHEPVPWSDLAEVRLSPASRKSALRVVAFIPRPGVVLPTVPTASFVARPQSRASALTKRFGSPLVVNPLRMGMSADRIAAAVQQLSGLPINPAPSLSPGRLINEPGSGV